MVTIKRFLINILMLRCGTMVFLLYLYLVIGLCGCNSKDGVPENLLPELLSITLSGKEELSIHPFLTADGGSYAVVLPAHWNIDELVAKYTSNDSFQVGETKMRGNWSPLHIELQKPYEMTGGKQITFYQVARKSAFINT